MYVTTVCLWDIAGYMVHQHQPHFGPCFCMLYGAPTPASFWPVSAWSVISFNVIVADLLQNGC